MERAALLTLQEATKGRKLRALPPRFGVGRGPWKPAEWSLRTAEKDFVNSWSVWRRAWRKRDDAAETFAQAHRRRHDQLRDALLAYTADASFVARLRLDQRSWQFAEACELAAERVA